MTILPTAGYMNNNARTQGEMKTAFEDQRQFIEDLLGTDSALSMVGKNLLVNGDFRVSRRGTLFTSVSSPANSDDTYLLDRWVLLSDGNDIVDVGQETSVVPTGAHNSISLDVELANNKFGIIQILEAKDAAALIGGTASLSFQARVTGTSIDFLRAAILAWDGAADAVTSDVVSTWNAVSQDPTLVANWTYENTPATLAALSTSFQTYKIENVSIDTPNAKNVAVFIWTDDVTMNVGDILYIGDVQLESGTKATPIARRPIEVETARCQRLYNRLGRGIAGHASSAAKVFFGAVFPVEMRAAPSQALLDNTPTFFVAGTTKTGTAATLSGVTATVQGFRGEVDGFTGLTGGDGATCDSDVLIEFDAEL